MSHFDKLENAEHMKIERRVYFHEKDADISAFTALPLEQLQALRGESAAEEQKIYDSLREAAGAWEKQAGKTLSLDKAVEYVRTPPVKHTANQWSVDSANSDFHSISNMVYLMTYHVNERKAYGHTGQNAPLLWDLTWNLFTNAPPNQNRHKIAGQRNKVFSDKAEMEKYLAGRIKAYSHLFTEISPPIPPAYAGHFRVNGQLLPGYTVEGEEPKHPDRAAAIGGGSISGTKPDELRKEHDTMQEPLNIQLITRELFESGDNSGGIWLKLPAAAEQLNAALARIGAANGEKDFFVNGIESPFEALYRIPFENVQKAGLDELNYLAAALQSRDEKQTAKLDAASEMIPGADTIHSLLELTQNTDCYDFHPDIFNNIQLGEHTLEYSGLIQIPDEWAAAVDVEMLGRLASENEKGRFTGHGYIVPNGGEWKPVAEIPKEYRIAPETENPNMEQDRVTTRTPAQTTAKPPQGRQAAPAEKSTMAQTAAKPPQGRQAAPAEKSTAAAPVIPLVLTAENPRDRMKEITDKLEAGIKGIFDSEQYKTYLKTLSKFHNYSFNNCLLIAMQSPGASHVAGFNAWRDDFKRQVRKGEKGIKILAPAPFKTKKTVDATDKNGRPVYKDGKRVKEEKEIIVPAFKITTVFDVSQTDGEPLPSLGVNELAGSVERYRDFFAALEKTSNVPIGFEAITTGAKGYFHQEEKRIAINEGMSELQNLKTAVHELAHSRLHDIDKNAPKDVARPDRRTREVEAESIAYTVCQHYGLDTSDYSFGYVANWSGEKQLDALKSSLDVIRREANAIITEINKHLAGLTQDREQTAIPAHEEWSEPATPENAPDNPGEPSDDINAYLPPQDGQAAPDKGDSQPPGETKTAATYYSINEEAARRAKQANSFYDYRPGSATAEYRQYVDEAVKLAERQKSRVDPMHHEKIDRLLDTYCRKLAENMNHRNAIDSRVPSVLIAGGSNFPVKQKEKQNAARDKNWGEWQEIQGLLDKIRSTGMGGISADDPNAVKKLESKLASLEQSQEAMKAVNAYYRKNKTLDGCPDLPGETIGRLKASMSRDWRADPKPFEAYALSNNNAEIHRTKARIEELKHREEAVLTGWQFEGGKVEVNRQDNRLQVFFDGKPGDDTRAELKSNGFRWAPSAGAWQRQINANAFYAANNIKSIQPLTGEKPTDLQRRARREADAAQQQAGQTAPEQGGTYAIYQLKDGDATRDYRFEPLERLQAAGLAVDAANYALVYSAPVSADTGSLGQIWEKFNTDRPEDFKGHSLSVSDVVVLNHGGELTAHYADSFGFRELPGFLAAKEPTRETSAPAINLTAVADYLSKHQAAVQAADPDKTQGQAVFNITVKRLGEAGEKIPEAHPQLKALLVHAAQSPDLAALKERMNTLHGEFIQHYATAVQMNLDTGGKAEPPAPAVSARRSEPAPAPKAPAQGENVAAIEAKVKAGETINLSDLSDAIKKDKQTAQTSQPGRAAPSRTNTRSRSAATSKPQEKPSIREEIAAGKKQLAGQKNTQTWATAKNKNAGLGE